MEGSNAERKVYPRPRGGTPLVGLPFSGYPGLSPPTRGNPLLKRAVNEHPRSIPAHAGEPADRFLFGGIVRVYPRPRGGTSFANRQPLRLGGLSPPTRGNPGQWRVTARLTGSIPAHAGEPPNANIDSKSSEVYPRPRGGTIFISDTTCKRCGLSPPTRGNRARRATGGQGRGSIPAHAGEPAARRRA